MNTDFPLFDFDLHLKMHTVAPNIDASNGPNIFVRDISGEFNIITHNLIKSYKGLVDLLYSLGIKPLLIENSMLIEANQQDKPSFLIEVLTQEQGILENYFDFVKQNLKAYGNVGPIVHHPELMNIPYYYTLSSRNKLNGQGRLFIERNDSLLEFVENNGGASKYTVRKYTQIAKDYNYKGQYQLKESLQNFFNKVVGLFHNSILNTEEELISLIIPYPNLSGKLRSVMPVAGGGIFIFGCTWIAQKRRLNNHPNYQIDNVELKVLAIKNYIHESLLKQSVSLSQFRVLEVNNEILLAHELKNSLGINVLGPLRQIDSSISSTKLYDVLSYLEKLVENRLVQYLKLHTSQENQMYTLENCNKFIINKLDSFTRGDVDIIFEPFSTKNQKVLLAKARFELIVEELCVNAIKYMDLFYKQKPFDKKIIVGLSQIELDNTSILKVTVTNTGTQIDPKYAEGIGFKRASSRVKGSTGWGHIIIHRSLNYMGAYSFGSGRLLSARNIHIGKYKGVEFSFMLQMDNY